MIGTGDGATDSVGYVIIATAEDGLAAPRDLGFHPERLGELWIVNQATDSVTIAFDATRTDGVEPETERRVDGFAMHFMEEVSSIAFGAKTFEDDYTFGTCQESENTYNDQAAANYFMGPVLWSARLDVFAAQDPEGLGSHLDMLHQSPNCMGIAHERDNAYWVFDGYHGQLGRYDFRSDHDVGQDDHADGVIHLFDEPRLARVERVPGHLTLDAESGLLYVADTGNSRVLWFRVGSGQRARDMVPFEDGTVFEEWTGAEWGELVPASVGLLAKPSGIALHGGYLYVADNETSYITAFDLEGAMVNVLDTGLRAGSLMGIEAGPDERLYVVDGQRRQVLRIEP